MVAPPKDVTLLDIGNRAGIWKQMTDVTEETPVTSTYMKKSDAGKENDKQRPTQIGEEMIQKRLKD